MGFYIHFYIKNEIIAKFYCKTRASSPFFPPPNWLIYQCVCGKGICLGVFMCVERYIFMSVSTRGRQRSTMGVSETILYFRCWRSLTGLVLDPSSGLANQWALWICLFFSLPLLQLGLQMHHHCARLWSASWDLNSGPHACETGNLLSPPSFQTWYFNFQL